MSNYGADKFRKVKGDITPYLFHYINGNDNNPFETLKSILNQKKLKSNKNDFICFTASPVTSMKKFFQTKVNRTGRPKYQPYGVGFSRDILIKEYGARNLIYFSKDEYLQIDEQLKWRSDILDVDSYDFEWLREWRIHGNEFNFSDFPKNEIIVITPTADELLDVVVDEEPEVFMTGNPITGEIDYYADEAYNRLWNGFTLKQIDLQPDDFALSASTISQVIGKDMISDIFKTLEDDKKE